MDPQAGLVAVQNKFPGLVIEVTGAGDHSPKVDVKSRRIKEVCRCVKSGLVWSLPEFLVKDLVKYAVSRTNIQRTRKNKRNVCLRVEFNRQEVNYKKKLALAFGDYVEPLNPQARSNTLKERTEPCIALFPLINFTGSWMCYKIVTKKRVRRSTNLRKCATTDLVRNQMNLLAGKGEVQKVAKVKEEVMDGLNVKDPADF